MMHSLYMKTNCCQAPVGKYFNLLLDCYYIYCCECFKILATPYEEDMKND